MNKQLIEDWITALRSGKYEQARFKLKDWKVNKYCCLGVACDIHPRMEWEQHRGNFNSYPPISIMVDYGIALGTNADLIEENRSIIGSIEMRHVGELLAYLNDELSWDFLKISDWIEQNLLPLAVEQKDAKDSM